MFIRWLAGRCLIRVRQSLRIEWTGWVQHLKSIVRNPGLPSFTASRRIERLEEQIIYRQLLLEEVIHRTKNTLQMAVAIIDDQIGAASDYCTRNALRAVQKQLRGLRRNHDRYYAPQYAETPTLTLRLSEICWSILDSFDDRSGRIKLSLSIADVGLNRYQEVSLSLIVDELLTNVFKARFTGLPSRDDRGEPRCRERLMCHVVVHDDGVGDYFVPRASTGSALVRGFASGLRGDFEVTRHNGTTARVSFPMVADPL
jgi:two-component sensor histidine kinase